MPEIKLHRERARPDVWKVFLTENGEEASRLWVFVKRMRIGSANVRIGGIGGVGTKQEHRLKGYASRIMDESTALMQDKNYDLGFLYGIQDFYHRFGYGVAFADVTLYAKTADLLRAKASLPARAMKRADGPEVARLYNRLNADRTGTAVRPASWQYFERSAGFQRPGRAVLTHNGRGAITGYATCSVREDRFVVSEIGGRSHADFETLAAALGRRARRAGIDTVAFHLPEDDPFADFCARYGCRMEIHHPRNAGPMARTIHLKPLMEKLVPEFTRRLEASGLAWRGALTLETDIGTVGLRINGTSVAVTPGRDRLRAAIPQMLLTQLVLGYRSAEDVARDQGVSIPKQALPVLSALFPRHPAYMWWSDRF